eukprot:363514-Chlamydomonas_euryale.AAC.11
MHLHDAVRCPQVSQSSKRRNHTSPFGGAWSSAQAGHWLQAAASPRAAGSNDWPGCSTYAHAHTHTHTHTLFPPVSLRHIRGCLRGTQAMPVWAAPPATQPNLGRLLAK